MIIVRSQLFVAPHWWYLIGLKATHHASLSFSLLPLKPSEPRRDGETPYVFSRMAKRTHWCAHGRGRPQKGPIVNISRRAGQIALRGRAAPRQMTSVAQHVTSSKQQASGDLRCRTHNTTCPRGRGRRASPLAHDTRHDWAMVNSDIISCTPVREIQSVMSIEREDDGRKNAKPVKRRDDLGMMTTMQVFAQRKRYSTIIRSAHASTHITHTTTHPALRHTAIATRTPKRHHCPRPKQNATCPGKNGGITGTETPEAYSTKPKKAVRYLQSVPVHKTSI